MDKVAIFAEALQQTTPEERRAYLDVACGGDVDLRAELEALLAAHDDAGSFLHKTPEELNATASIGPDSNDDAWKSFLCRSESDDCLGSLGDYEVSDLIGRGGMGVVLRARDSKLNRVVAIKMLAPEWATDRMSVRRFLREAQATAAVSHDHVVTIHAIDEDIHPPIIVMELVEGKSLQQKIDVEGVLDVKSILRVGMQTAAGLSAAHRQGLVHRDVKPAIILLENGIERVKLTDFGLARAIDDVGMTKTGTVTGTPQYMSPEQAQGQPVDHRTDLFSLGCVLYAMCTGRAAFRADSAVAVMHCVVHESPRPIREINEDTPDWLCNIVEKLLAKDPSDRFQSAAEVETLLSQHLAHLQQPESVPQPSKIATVATQNNSERETESSDAVELPGWLMTRIPAWLLILPVVLFVIALAGGIRFGPQELTVICVGFAVWAITQLLIKNRPDESNSDRNERLSIVVALGLSLMLSWVYVVVFWSPLVATLATALTAAILIWRRKHYLNDLHEGLTLGNRILTLGRRMAGTTAITGLCFLLLCSVLWFGRSKLWKVPIPTPEQHARHQVSADRGRQSEKPFVQAKTSYKLGREPRDPIVDLEVSSAGLVCVAVRGKVSPGYIRLSWSHRTRTIGATGIRDLSLSGDEKIVWVGGAGMPRLVSSSGNATGPEFDAVDDELSKVEWSPDKQVVVTCGTKGAYVWNARKGGAPVSTLADFGNAQAVSWSPDGRKLAIGYSEQLVILDSDTVEPTVTLQRPSTVTAIDWSADSSHLLIGCADGSLALADNAGRLTEVSSAESFSCDSVAFSPDNIWIIAAENQNYRSHHRIRIQINPKLDPEYKPDLPSPIFVTDSARNQETISCLKVTSDGRRMVIATSDGAYTKWEFANALAYNVPNASAPFQEIAAEAPE